MADFLFGFQGHLVSLWTEKMAEKEDKKSDKKEEDKIGKQSFLQQKKKETEEEM